MPVSKSMSLAEKEVILTKLCRYDDSFLKNLNKSDLIDLIGGYKGLINNAKRLPLKDILEQVINQKNTYKQDRLKDFNNIFADSNQLQTYTEIFKEAFKGDLTAKELANKIVLDWNVKGYTDTTICKTMLGKISMSIEILKGEKISEDFKKYLDNFNNHLRSDEFSNMEKIEILTKDTVTGKVLKSEYLPYSIQNLNRKINNDRKYEVNKPSLIGEKRKIEGKKILEFCERVIEEAIKNEGKVKSWYALSLALACTSGRRMQEIHGETVHHSLGITREYKILENGKLFINQLAKSLPSHSFEFDTLIDNKKWLLAYSKLPDNCLKMADNKVNSIVSSVVNKTLRSKNIYKDLNFEMYKDSRDFYIAYRVATEYLADREKTGYYKVSDFILSIIGHQEKSMGNNYEKLEIV
jgi:hypothetical protein